MAVGQKGSGQNVYDFAAQYLKDAGNTYGAAATGQPILSSMNSYLNPYYDEVLNSATSRMRDERDMALNQVGAGATAAGAFGGSRHGLVESQIYDDTTRGIGDLTARLKGQGFNTAAQLAGQDAQLNLQGAAGLAGMGQTAYGIGNDLTDRTMQQGSLQQQLLQTILSGAAGQVDNKINSPMQLISLLTSVMHGDPRRAAGSTTQSTTPGAMDWLGLAAQLGGRAMTAGWAPWGA